MSKLMIAEQGHGFEIQKDARHLLGYVPTQPNMHDTYDVDDSHTHIKSLSVKSQKFPPAGAISLADAKVYLGCDDEHTILVFYHKRLDDEDVVIVRIGWFHITTHMVKKMRGELTLDHAIRFAAYIKSLSGDKDECRAAAQQWKKRENLRGLNTILTLNPKIGVENNRIQISTTTPRLTKILPLNEYGTVSHEEYQSNSITYDTFPSEFKRLFPMLGRRYSAEKRFK